MISALEGIPIDQEIAMTGSLSVRGEVLPVGGVNNKVLAAIEAGIKTVIIPSDNAQDIYLNSKELKKIKIVPAKNIADVLAVALKKSERSEAITSKLRKYISGDSREKPPLVVEGKDLKGR